jgi:uncharacterized protein YjdB
MALSRCEFVEMLRWAQSVQSLRFTFRVLNVSTSGVKMNLSLQVGFAVPFTTSAVDALGNPAQAKLSGFSFTSSDSTIFSVGATPGVDDGSGVVTGLKEGTGTMTATATATEPDGTAHQVQGVATVTITGAPTPIPPAAALVFDFGTSMPVTSK